MKRTTLYISCLCLLCLLCVSCTETQQTFELKTKVTHDLNFWQINDGSIRTMQKDHFEKWAVNIDGSKTIFSGTANSLTGDIYGNNSPGKITLSTKFENDLCEWIYSTNNINGSVLYIQTKEANDLNVLEVYDEQNSIILEITTRSKNDFTGWDIRMYNHQMDLFTDPHYFGLYLIPVLIAVDQYH